MAGRGPAPQATRSRPRDTARREAEMQKIEEDNELRGFPLPKGIVEGGWHQRTESWWDTWRRSPQAQTFIDTDWDFLLDTAVMHHAMYSEGEWKLGTEIRIRVAKFGATPEDRMRLKLQVETPDSAKKPRPAAAGSVTDITSRRSRLVG